MTDFRSDRSESPEGQGRARRAWDAYARRVSKVASPVALPLMEPAIRRVANTMTVDLLGFWMAWHIYGGFEGLVEFGMHPSTCRADSNDSLHKTDALSRAHDGPPHAQNVRRFHICGRRSGIPGGHGLHVHLGSASSSRVR